MGWDYLIFRMSTAAFLFTFFRCSCFAAIFNILILCVCVCVCVCVYCLLIVSMLFEALNTTKVFHDNDVLFLNTEEINIEYSPLMFLLS